MVPALDQDSLHWLLLHNRSYHGVYRNHPSKESDTGASRVCRGTAYQEHLFLFLCNRPGHKACFLSMSFLTSLSGKLPFILNPFFSSTSPPLFQSTLLSYHSRFFCISHALKKPARTVLPIQMGCIIHHHCIFSSSHRSPHQEQMNDSSSHFQAFPAADPVLEARFWFF